MNSMPSRWEIAELDAETAAVQHSLTARGRRRVKPTAAASELLERHASLLAADAGLFGAKADRAR